MSTLNTHTLWCEKYRPQKISDYIFHGSTHRKPIMQMIESGDLPHLLLSGIQGSGKTTLAKLLTTEIDIDPLDVLFVNASDENSVDVMRDKLKSFISTFAIGKYKVVILDEADYISHAGQAILRNMLENNTDNVRFILTCNYENKIINPLKSRLQHFRFKSPNIDDVTELVATILVKESIEFDLDTLDTYIAVGYPDVRKIINLLQQNSVNLKLLTSNPTSETLDYKFSLLDFISQDDWDSARSVVCDNVVGEEWYEVYNFLFKNLEKSPKFKKREKWDDAILILAEHAHKHEFVAAPEINAAAMFIKLTLV